MSPVPRGGVGCDRDRDGVKVEGHGNHTKETGERNSEILIGINSKRDLSTDMSQVCCKRKGNKNPRREEVQTKMEMVWGLGCAHSQSNLLVKDQRYRLTKATMGRYFLGRLGWLGPTHTLREVLLLR